MVPYQELSRNELLTLKEQLTAEYKEIQALGLALDMSRGKPSIEQTKLSEGLLHTVQDFDELLADGVDCTNYGLLDGIPSAKKLMGYILDRPAESVFVAGNSSLNLMHDCISFAYIHGVPNGEKPWGKQDVKFLCPCPGYDRHFAVAEHFGFELIPIDIHADGPDMDQVREAVKDPTVKGIWCIPRYSNPTGITYSDEVTRGLATMETAAPDFRVFWDNAYVIHHHDWDDKDTLLNIMEEAEKVGNEDRILTFTSTSKITYPGGGIAAVACSPNNLAWVKKHMSLQTIGYDKISQLRHVRFLSSPEVIEKHMREQSKHLVPKFNIVLKALDTLKGLEIAQWNAPKGGYFITLETLDGCAKRIVELCKNAGVTMTPAGATHPYGIDPKDKTIRISPTYPPCHELEQAAALLCLCVRLASVEKLLA